MTFDSAAMLDADDKQDLSHVAEESSSHGLSQTEHANDKQTHGVEIEQRLERRLKLKMDLIILPLFATVYFLASMDRSDLGNAKVAGLTKTLHINNDQFSTIAGMFYVGYVVFQMPGTLLLREFTPPLQFGGAMILWGTVTCCFVAAKNYSTLAGLRFLVGVSEAFFQGAVLYLSIMYTRRELALRISIVFATSALASAFNGLIAYGIQENLAGVHGWESYQWLFLVEGVLPIGWAFVIIAFLPSTPELARRFFSADEKKLMIKRSRQGFNTGHSRFEPWLILKLLGDLTFWMLVCIYAALNFCLAGLNNFLPSVLQGLGWSIARTQAMSVVVYAVAFVWCIACAWLSDRIGQRAIIISGNCLVTLLGFALALGLRSVSGRFVAACLVGAGLYPSIALTLTWTNNSLAGHMYRASGIALINACAQTVAISAAYAYNTGPPYAKGHAVSLAMAIVAAAAAALLRMRMTLLNRRKQERKFSPEAQLARQQTVDDIGNRHPDFFFVY